MYFMGWKDYFLAYVSRKESNTHERVVAIDDSMLFDGNTFYHPMTPSQIIFYSKVNELDFNLIKKETDCSVHVVPNAIRTTFPPISVQRLNHELGCTPRPITALISDLVNAYQREATKQ